MDYAAGLKKEVADVKFLIHDLRVESFFNEVIHYHVTVNTDLEIHSADQALYASKRMGRNRVSIYADVAEGAASGLLCPCPQLVGRRFELMQATEAAKKATSGTAV